MKHLKFGRGTTSQEDSIIGLEGELRVDLSRGEIRAHDGVTLGGKRIPSIDTVQALIAQRAEGSSGSVAVCTDVAQLKDVTPDSTTLAVVTAAGLEEAYIWRSGAADQGEIASNISGHWRRLDSAAGFLIRMWRAALVNLQVDGGAPAASQDTTAWIDNGVVKYWNGAAYVAGTPTLFARLLAYIGGYSTAAFVLPANLDATESDIADLDTITDSGWYRTTAGAANSPIAGVHSVEHRQIVAVTTAVQILYSQGSANQDTYVRYLTASVWGAWTLVSGQLPTRLGATALLVTDANSATDSGFYHAASTALHIPAAADGVLIMVKYSSTDGGQLWMPIGSNQLWARQFTGSVWSAWVEIDFTAAMLGPMIAGLAAKATPVDADILVGADSAAANAGKGTTYLQAWTNYFLVKANALFATIASLALKADAANPAFTGTATGLTKAMVGLGNVDNTTDVGKPVSTAQQTALNLKSDTSHTHAFSALTSKPTTVAGYGITDAEPRASSSSLPVGFSAYLYNAAGGITDGATSAGSSLRIIDGTTLAGGGAALPGTWKNISGATVTSGATGLWVRTA